MTVEKNEKGKWVAEVKIGRETKTSPPLKTKREGEEWIETKKLEAILGSEDIRLMSAAIVKGIIEKKDGTAYFGSTTIYTYHFSKAVEYGYVTVDKKVTKRGKEWYRRCLKHLVQARQVYWGSQGGVGWADPNIKN